MGPKMNKKLKFCLRLCGAAWLLGSSIVGSAIFLRAYCHISQSVLVTVNRYGEANIEFIMLLIGVPLSFYFLCCVFRGD